MNYRGPGAIAILVCLVVMTLPVAARAAEGDLVWNTFIGTGSTESFDVAVDSSGNVYVTGLCGESWGSPIRPYTRDVDAFVAKYSTDGSLMWNTFIGGNERDEGLAISVDMTGNVYVTGRSYGSWGSPVRPFTGSTETDAFVARLASDGTLLWNTFLGGSSWELVEGIAVDATGNAYVTGTSNSTWGTPWLPATPSTSVFVAKLDSNGSLVWNTFLGGNGGDYGFGIAVGKSGDVYVAGYSSDTWGAPIWPYVKNDGFVAKLTSYGVLSWNIFLGGSGSDICFSIAVDSGENVCVAGRSDTTWGLPIRAYSAMVDVFVVKLDSNGMFWWNTFLGGTGGDFGYKPPSISVDSKNSVYVSGTSELGWDTPIRPYTWKRDAFAAKLADNGSLLWNTFLGGIGGDSGYGIAVDKGGNAFVAGWSTATWGSPLNPFSGGGFIAKLQGSGVASGPAITSITSRTSKAGSTATIKGTGFSTTKTKNIVYFGTKKAPVNRAKATSITVTIPRVKKGTVDVYVEVNGVKSNIFKFQVK